MTKEEAQERRQVFALVIVHAMIAGGNKDPDPKDVVRLADGLVAALAAPPPAGSQVSAAS